MSRNKYFPRDCGNCEYFYRYDLNVGDWTSKCLLYGMEHDDCESFIPTIVCPKVTMVRAKYNLILNNHRWVKGRIYGLEVIIDTFTITSEKGWIAFTDNVKEDVLDLFEII